MRSSSAMFPRRRAVALASVVAFLAACGSSSGEGGGSAADEDSPLDVLFGGNDSSAEARAKQLEQEEAVALCMKESGWEYTPVDWEAQFGNDAGAEDADLSPKEYGEKYAYGIVRNYELYELPYLLGEDDPSVTTPEFVDPNQDYVQTLSPDEQEQYYAELYGEPQMDVAEGEEYVPPPIEEQGCYGKAQQEVYGDQAFNDPDISERMNELFEDLENDPAIIAAERDWKACMTDADETYDFPGPDEVWAYFDRRKYELGGQEIIETTFDPQTGEPLDDIDMSDVYTSSYGEDGSGYVVIGQPDALSEDEIETLRTEERAVWDTDQSCREDSDFAEVRREAEQELVDVMLQEFPQLEDGAGLGQG